MNKIKRPISFFLILILLLNFQFIFAQPNNKLDGMEKIAESKYLELYFDSNNKTLAIKDKRNNYIWSSNADEEYLKKNGIDEFFLKNYSALWLLTYTNLAGQESTTKTYSSTRSDVELKSKKLSNGLQLDFYIPKIRVKFSIKYELNDDNLTVSIPANSIQELIGMKQEIEDTINKTQNQLSLLRNLYKSIRRADVIEVATKKRLNNIATDLDNIENTLSNLKGVDDLNRKAATISTYAYDINAELLGSQEKGKGIIELYEKRKGADKKVIDNLKKMSETANDMYNFGDNYRLLEVAGIVKIDLMPYFGSAGDNEKGYMLIPDGCGAISTFKPKHAQYLSYYSKEIYTDNIYDLDRYNLEANNGLKEISMPVIGVKKGNNAFVAIAEKGAANSLINYMPSGYEVNLNRIYYSFRYRRLFETITKNWNGQYYKIYETTPVVTDRQIKFYFLANDKASYSGMANKIREFLIFNKLIKKSKLSLSKLPLGLDVFMGIKEERILFDKFIPMTTFQQTKEIISQLKKNGIDNILLNLIGWAKGGYDIYPTTFWSENKLGGEDALNELLNYSNSINIPIFLQVNLIDAYSKVGGFSLNKDVVRMKNGKQLTNYKHNKFLFSPTYIFNSYYKRLENYLLKKNNIGVSLEKIGWYVYPDYRGKNVLSKEDTAFYWEKILNNLNNKNINIATSEGNLYVLKYADRIINLPYKSSGYSYFDEDIPFYQMVIHGLIPYSMKAFNLFYDTQQEKLKAIEYGAIPYYQITYKDSSELKYTNYKQLFTSKYQNWEQDIVKTYKQFNTVFKNINDKYIIEHRKIDNQLVEVTYSNGTKIYINYSKENKKINNITISPNNIRVVNQK